MLYTRRTAIKAGLCLSAGVVLGPSPALARSGGAPFDADVGLDPGHSYVDVGASGAGVGEFQHTLDVAFRIQPLLATAGLSVNLSRTTADPVSPMSDPDPTERIRIEQLARIQAVGRVRAVHRRSIFNAGAAGNTSLSGTETYYNADNAGDESFRLATALQQSVLAALWDYGYPALDRGVKDDLIDGKPYGHFFSLRGGMPSALVESLFEQSDGGETAAPRRRSSGDRPGFREWDRRVSGHPPRSHKQEPRSRTDWLSFSPGPGWGARRPRPGGERSAGAVRRRREAQPVRRGHGVGR